MIGMKRASSNMIRANKLKRFSFRQVDSFPGPIIQSMFKLKMQLDSRVSVLYIRDWQRNKCFEPPDFDSLVRIKESRTFLIR